MIKTLNNQTNKGKIRRSGVLGPVLALSLAAVVLVACVVPALQAVGGEVYASMEATFTATELLGRPTDSSVTVNVLAEQDLEVYFEYGTEPSVYTGQTSVAEFPGGDPIEVVIGGLQSNMRYYYRMVYREIGTTDWIAREEHSFHTQRAPGSTFTFTIISDSHMNGGGGNANLYQQTLNNVLADNPDFHLDLGDTFWMDGVTSSTTANQRYLQQRQYMGTISHSASIFVSTGNHENEEGWNFDDTNSKALLSVNARKLYYPNPIPDSFYTGNTDDSLTAISGDHLREDYYAWEWGDALFVVIDPFQYTMIKPYAGSLGGEDNDETVIGDRWDWTLGEQQYQWFKQTLEESTAMFKFVFAHHVTGGTQDYVRGGAEAAPYFEWGGRNWDGTWGFDTERSGWETPIHELMVANGVTAFFHGHDHEFAKEELDGIVYQLCPQPSDSSYGYGFNLYHESDPFTDVVLPNSGHLRVTVSPSQVTVDYVRAYLSGGANGEVAYTYTIAADNVPPVAYDQALSTDEDAPVVITLTASDADGDELFYNVVAAPSYGSLSGTAPYLTYTPNLDYTGLDSFSFKANDGFADSNSATVTINVTAEPEILLLLTVMPNQASYVKEQPVTLTVNVFNQLNPPLEATLTLTVTSPNNYCYFDLYPISVSSDAVREYRFAWVVPDVAGTYALEVELVPSTLTAYDTVWLKVA